MFEFNIWFISSEAEQLLQRYLLTCHRSELEPKRKKIDEPPVVDDEQPETIANTLPAPATAVATEPQAVTPNPAESLLPPASDGLDAATTAAEHQAPTEYNTLNTAATNCADEITNETSIEMAVSHTVEDDAVEALLLFIK